MKNKQEKLKDLKDLKVALATPKSSPIWKARGENGETRVMKMSDMDNEHLQKAFFLCQRDAITLHNQIMIKSKLADQLEDEATNRGLVLKELSDVINVSKVITNRKILKHS